MLFFRKLFFPWIVPQQTPILRQSSRVWQSEDAPERKKKNLTWAHCLMTPWWGRLRAFGEVSVVASAKGILEKTSTVQRVVKEEDFHPMWCWILFSYLLCIMSTQPLARQPCHFHCKSHLNPDYIPYHHAHGPPPKDLKWGLMRQVANTSHHMEASTKDLTPSVICNL